MTIENRDWYAQNNTMPGDPFFHVRGKVTVNSPAIEPVLVPFDGPQFKDLVLRLTLELEEQEGIFPAVVSEKEVNYRAPALAHHAPYVEIHHDGKILVAIPVQETC
ncbi:hypothetical protein [Pseudomonas faucium]|uniref:hypothetical protein n=1 Tax=Pseudomonas faucium TaxID=2740518 RepID=UPI001F1E5EB9|nr:hypothetical protein [Pseudomonas faucium]